MENSESKELDFSVSFEKNQLINESNLKISRYIQRKEERIPQGDMKKKRNKLFLNVLYRMEQMLIVFLPLILFYHRLLSVESWFINEIEMK
jgi:hypothetical protein